MMILAWLCCARLHKKRGAPYLIILLSSASLSAHPSVGSFTLSARRTGRGPWVSTGRGPWVSTGRCSVGFLWVFSSHSLGQQVTITTPSMDVAASLLSTAFPSLKLEAKPGKPHQTFY